ncbi:hypothetical protein KCP77_09645 [Salmonella enterica subsp. enterica]|nr:hypothetical protein KCP77_09645 [Salmonella enterica subsp. enterica]
MHFTRFFLNTLLGWAALLTVANPKPCSALNRTFWQYAGHWRRGKLYDFRSTAASRCEDGGDMADTFASGAFWLTRHHRKWTIEGIETQRAVAGLDGLLRQSSDPYIGGARGTPAS